MKTASPKCKRQLPPSVFLKSFVTSTFYFRGINNFKDVMEQEHSVRQWHALAMTELDSNCGCDEDSNPRHHSLDKTFTIALLASYCEQPCTHKSVFKMFESKSVPDAWRRLLLTTSFSHYRNRHMKREQKHECVCSQENTWALHSTGVLSVKDDMWTLIQKHASAGWGRVMRSHSQPLSGRETEWSTVAGASEIKQQ